MSVRLVLSPAALLSRVGASLSGARTRSLVGAIGGALRGVVDRVLVRRPLLLLAVTCALVTVAPPVGARAETESPYTRRQTFNGALRYLRVDLGFEVVERDFDAGYLLFKYVPLHSDTPTRGSIEVIEVQGNVKVVVALPEQPNHHETMLSDGLMKKLEIEYGEPPPRKDSDADEDKRNEGDEDGGDASEDDDSDPSEGDDGSSAPAPSKKTRRKLKRRRSRN